MFKIHYTALELDRTPGGGGDCDDPGEIDETTLCLHRWGEAAEKWIRVTPRLHWVNYTGIYTTNPHPYDKLYKGYAWVDVNHLSLYGLAGDPCPAASSSGP